MNLVLKVETLDNSALTLINGRDIEMVQQVPGEIGVALVVLAGSQGQRGYKVKMTTAEINEYYERTLTFDSKVS